MKRTMILAAAVIVTAAAWAQESTELSENKHLQEWKAPIRKAEPGKPLRFAGKEENYVYSEGSWHLGSTLNREFSWDKGNYVVTEIKGYSKEPKLKYTYRYDQDFRLLSRSYAEEDADGNFIENNLTSIIYDGDEEISRSYWQLIDGEMKLLNYYQRVPTKDEKGNITELINRWENTYLYNGNWITNGGATRFTFNLKNGAPESIIFGNAKDKDADSFFDEYQLTDLQWETYDAKKIFIPDSYCGITVSTQGVGSNPFFTNGNKLIYGKFTNITKTQTLWEIFSVATYDDESFAVTLTDYSDPDNPSTIGNYHMMLDNNGSYKDTATSSELEENCQYFDEYGNTASTEFSSPYGYYKILYENHYDGTTEDLEEKICYYTYSKDIEPFLSEKVVYSNYFDLVPTGIQQVKAADKQKNADALYNLSGQRVSRNFKGIVIKNGKKFIQK